MQSIVNGLEGQYRGRISFVRINILNPKNAGIMEQYGFSATPELYLVNASGKVVGFWDEVNSREDFQHALDAAMKE